LVKRLQTEPRLRLRYLYLAHHQDTAPSFRLSTSSAENLKAFSGVRQAIGRKIWRLSPICCHWVGQPQVNHWNRGALDVTRRLEED
jgi:hypothetical protein